MAFVERIAFEVEGEGEPVLMIHGLGGTSNTWTGLLPSLARHKKIRFDLPGSGRSHRVEGSLSTQRFLEKALLVMGRAGAERVHVVAHSMGGLAVRRALMDHPELANRVRTFVTLGTPHAGGCARRHERQAAHHPGFSQSGGWSQVPGRV